MPHSRGHLNPGSPGVTVERFELAPALAELVRHAWVARWDLREGEVSRQRVLAYPAFNVVIAPNGTTLFGPDPRLQVRELSGQSWVLGLLMLPVAGPLLSGVPPVELVGKERPLDGAPRGGQKLRPELIDEVSRWLLPMADRIDDRGRQVNAVCQLAEKNADIVRVEELAERVGMSRRSLERLVMSHVGVSPKWLIECRRLQQAATTLHAKPDTQLTQLALELGYADHAHFSRRYKEVLGETPDQTRQRTSA